MRTVIALLLSALVISCASTTQAGPVGEGFQLNPAITAVDTTHPPGHVAVELDRPGHVAVLLVVPGYSATLLFPPDSTTSNRFQPGTHTVPFRIPDVLVRSDSARPRLGQPDTGRGGARSRTRGRTTMPMPVPQAVDTYLLLVTSPQELDYRRIIEKTAGVSIPTAQDEALNAVGKAIKSTLQTEPREWAGYFVTIDLTRPGS